MMKKQPRINNHQVIRKKEAKEKFVAPISGKDKILKESSNTHKVTNGTNFISQSEPSAPKEMTMEEKNAN